MNRCIYARDGETALRLWKAYLKKEGFELGQELREVSVALVHLGVWEGSATRIATQGGQERSE